VLRYLGAILVGGIGYAERDVELREAEREQARAEKRWLAMFTPTRWKCFRGRHHFDYVRNEAGEATHLVCKRCGIDKERP
jgi:hypothetical protein